MRTILILAWLAIFASAQTAKPEVSLELEAKLRARLAAPMTEFDLDLVMLGDDFFGTEPQPLRFSPDGTELWFSWKRWDERESGTFVCRVADGTVRRLSDDEDVPPPWVWSRDRTARAAVQDGTLALVRDGVTSSPLRLAQAPYDLQFSPQADALLFRSGNGFFRLLSGNFEQLLVLGEGKRKPEPAAAAAPSPKDPTLAEWHKQRERALFRVHWEEFEREERNRVLEVARKARRKTVFNYEPPEGWRVNAVELSPTGLHALTILEKETARGRSADMPDYLSADGYTSVRPTRAKVGEVRAERSAELVDIAANRITPLKLPSEKLDASSASFSPDGTALLLVATARDDTCAMLLGVAIESGALAVLHEVRDEAWVLTRGLLPDWLGDGHSGVFVSEKNGWMQLWRVDAASGEVRQLVEGHFEVSQVEVAADGRTLWCVATPLSPHVRDLVRVDAEDGSMTVISADAGGRRILLSPDNARLAEVYSKPNQPWELRLRDLRSGTTRTVTDSPSPAFLGHDWLVPEIVRIPASDGVQVPARIYRPTANGSALRPAVIFVHGAGYLQNVHDWWSRYAREYAFHHLLRAEGFVVLDMDYRGSSGYGRDWRTAIRGHMGGRDLEDHVDAARWLTEHENVDPARIGLYGGSYGGFLTLMAMFTKAGVFAAGAALRPVTDWAHYNDGYTANILDTPLENPDAFARSSPIDFAAGLRGRLLLCHGLRDDNVHAQDTVRLQQRLIELRKSDFEVAYYPAEAHGFRDGASWSDEYRRILALMRTLQLSTRR
ncbi:MAG: S9 family peptidase [Planctomycetes bacterium]|nr:S9 family peptidase [Planctomycetota bacterium]